MEKTPESCEPRYKNHKREEHISRAKRILILLSLCTIFLYTVSWQQILTNTFSLLSLFLNISGTYFCYLIIIKKLHVYNKYADKVCSLLKQQNCNNLLESEASNLGGIIGLGEAGLGYFLSNIFILFYFPQFIGYTVIINTCAIIFSFWSIWYQALRAKQWCTLCLSVIATLWLIFIVNIYFVTIEELNFTVDIVIVGLIYLLFIFGLNILLEKIILLKSKTETSYELNSIKANENVFQALLLDSLHYEVEKSTSSILFGNKESNIIVTVLTNPHCEPCANMHRKVEKLLSTNKNLCVQYIFSDFNTKLESSSKALISIYLSNDEKDVIPIFDEWFTSGKLHPSLFFKKYVKLDMKENVVEEESKKHKDWKANTKLQATPTILVNGYLIPENYKIEDLKYFYSL